MPKIISEEWCLFVQGINPIVTPFLQIGVSSCEGVPFIAAIGSSVRWVMFNFFMDDFVTRIAGLGF